MSGKSAKFRKTPFEFKGMKGVVVHDRLIADGPIDPETGKKLINPETGKPFPGKNDDVAKKMLEYVRKFRGERSINGQPVARFGVLTHLAKTTPIYLYDHPRLNEICQTAFTDGVGVFFNADFFRKCVEQEEKNMTGKAKFGILPVIIHEMLHKIKYHNTRMQDIPHGIANRAQDRHINALYRKCFIKDMPFIPMLTTMLEAGTEAAAAKYEEASEEIIGRQMYQEYEQRRQEIIEEHKKQKKKKGSSGSGGGGSSGGGSGSSSGDNSSGNNGGQNEKFNPDQEDKKDSENGGGGDDDLQKKLDDLDEEFMGDRHHITIEEMIEIFEEEGLENVARALEYPTNKDDSEGLEKLLKNADASFDKALLSTQIEMNRMSDPSAYPGAHIANEVASMIRHLRKNKIRWQLDFTNSVVGDSAKLREDEDTTTPVYYMKFGEGMDEIYDPALVTQKSEDVIVVIFDTSGSTQQGDLREQLASEMLGLIDSCQGNENAKEVLLVSGDTVLRGEPIPINRGNIELVRKEGIPLFGNGGTDIGNCIKELMESDMIKRGNKKVKHIIYVTDCEDNVPPKTVLGEYADKFTFTVMSTRNCYSEKWDKELTWGKVVFIENGAEANLDFRARAAELGKKQEQFKQKSFA